MQAARLTQDYYGFIRHPAVSRKDAGADKPQASRPPASVLPAERVVEGEVLRDRGNSTSDSLDQILHRGRFTAVAANAPDATLTTQAARRAINAYLDNAAIPNSSGGVQPRSIDYYA
jgi:hypothetical protein